MATIISEKGINRSLHRTYLGILVLFLAAYGLMLLLLLDVVRGLFALSTPQRWSLVAACALAMFYAFHYMRGLETRLGPYINLQKVTRWLVGILISIPLIAIILYRVVGGARATISGALQLPETWVLRDTPVYIKPIMVALSYMNDTWFATLLAILISGAVLAFLSPFLKAKLRHNGWRAHSIATSFAIPNMFCSCCASPIARAATG